MYRYHCTCGYTAEVAGREHSSDGVHTNTVVCSSCRELVDVITAVQPGATAARPAGECPRCGSRYQRPWTARACPRCTRTMSRERL